MAHRIDAVTEEEMQLEVQLKDRLIKDDVAELMLLYTEGARGGMTLEQAYDTFRLRLNQRWSTEVNPQTTYMVVEAIVKLTTDLKKKHIAWGNSQPSASTSKADSPEEVK